MASSSNYHLPAFAAMAGIALAASGYVLSTNSNESRRRRRRIKSKLMKERDGRYILGLVNTGNSCFINSVLQAGFSYVGLLTILSEKAERVDEQGDDSGPIVPPNEFILQSVAFALYSTIEMLNRPLSRPRSVTPVDIVQALERKTHGTINREQQDAHELFQIISSVLTSEEEEQYREQTPSLLDVNAIRNMATENDPAALDNLETASMSSVGTMGSMWSSFSVSTVGGQLRQRPRRPRNPFTGLAASRVSCMKCGYTAPIRHHTFDNISLTVPQTLSCTLESCLSTYTKVDVLTDFQCRKCILLATLDNLTHELTMAREKSTEKNNVTDGNGGIKRLEEQIQHVRSAIRYNIENPLPGIPLTTPKTVSCTTKQTMFANPPKSLCLHLSRSVYHPSGYIQKNHCNVHFPEFLDLAPYTTNGFLNANDPATALSSPPSVNVAPQQARTSRTSLVYLRNMAGGNRFVHGRDGLNVALASKEEEDQRPIQNALPSLTLPAIRAIQYRLTAVIVHYGSHDSGHFITYRRKKLPTGYDVRPPLGENGSRSPSKFWQCSDDIVKEVDAETVLASEAYMLFYERDV
ncbi:hypothetical protein DFQ28_008451 [Apophysomyces sp. BC1034]|nr:hypothetical protein DFQ30_008290 [Apophysomyces sp. BC1015]KAG0174111.1 hypothetical protein DFQ29_007601 [Apophysomyces sp. BC1021]KAG0186010.1 hypothetical protein DFQ28_008451 [Apophysomyces sp. BC1034]